MEKIIDTIHDASPIISPKLRVAAYARVSCGKDTMLHSLAAQINFYHQLITSNLEWEFAGVFADEAMTGTKEDRAQFQEILSQCRAGSINMVITKSISRFARNTVTLLNTVRELKGLGVDVFFEEQNIHTISTDGELMLTLLASFAQAESYSCSENCKWRIRAGFAKGIPTPFRMKGYRLIDGEIVVVPEEAATVQRIFELYLRGYGLQRIANVLNSDRQYTVNGGLWCSRSVAKILDNEKYCGDLLLQKTYRNDHLEKTKHYNTAGLLPRYLVRNNHEPIIDKAIFQRVVSERKRRAVNTGPRPAMSALSGMIRCECCGKNYRRKTTSTCIKWCCSTYNTRGKNACPDSKMIPEELVLTAINDVLGTDHFIESLFLGRVDHIDACKGNMLRFCFRDGTTMDYVWRDRSRSESWTSEMRQAASIKTKTRYEHAG